MKNKRRAILGFAEYYRQQTLDDTPSKGMCFAISHPLQIFLGYFKINTVLQCGSLDNEPRPHYWLKWYYNYIVDATADQYDLIKLPAIIVHKMPKHYKGLTIDLNAIEGIFFYPIINRDEPNTPRDEQMNGYLNYFVKSQDFFLTRYRKKKDVDLYILQLNDVFRSFPDDELEAKLITDNFSLMMRNRKKYFER